MPGLSDVLKNSRRTWQAKQAASQVQCVENPYALLGITHGATENEIQSAFRKASRKVHPDRHPEDKDASAKFIKLVGAKERLMNFAQGRCLKRKWCEAATENFKAWKRKVSPDDKGKKKRSSKNGLQKARCGVRKGKSREAASGLLGFLQESRKGWLAGGARCPKGHALRASCEKTPWYCDYCNRRSVQNTMERHQCVRCNFDLCEQCAKLHEQCASSVQAFKIEASATIRLKLSVTPIGTLGGCDGKSSQPRAKCGSSLGKVH